MISKVIVNKNYLYNHLDTNRNLYKNMNKNNYNPIQIH